MRLCILLTTVFIASFQDASGQIMLRWTERGDLNASFPSGVKIYQTEGVLPSGRPVRAWYAELAPTSNVELRAVAAAGLTPTSAIAAQNNAVLAVNAGFFTTPSASLPSGSVSLIITDSLLVARNIAALTRRGPTGANATFYPTRCAFGLSLNSAQASSIAGFTPEVTWVYSTGTAPASPTYSYSTPSPNVEGQAPQPVPGEIFPSGAQRWHPQMAIGGMPMLVYQGVKRLTTSEELTPADIPPANPRTAIGYRADGAILLVVVDGRQSVSMGADLGELADMMLGLGCTGAINLDGGGSSVMIARTSVAAQPSQVQYRAVNTPIDAGVAGRERAVGSALVVKARAQSTTTSTSAERRDIAAARQGNSSVVLHQNYPNPFSLSTTISFTVPKPSRVSLRVVDALGRVVVRLLDGVFVQAGITNVEWQADVSAGVYFSELETPEGLQKERLTVVR
jgi:hypothetical protein